MTLHVLETTITVGSSEVPATVEFFIEPSDDSVGYSGGVVIENVKLHHPKDPKRSVLLVEGLLFDAVTDDWLVEQCIERVLGRA